MKLVPQVVITAVSLAISFATVTTQAASAAIVNYSFIVDSSINKGKGFFSFDDSTFSNDNIPEAIVKSLSFQFDGQSTIYTEKDDLAYPDFPVVISTRYLTGRPTVGLSYSFYDKTNPANQNIYEIVGENLTILSGISSNTEIGFGRVSYTQVPEPETLGGSLLTFGLFWIAKRKITLIKKTKV